MKITDRPWKCPACDSDLNPEEVEQVTTMLNNGQDQVEMRCDDCGEQLTADTTYEDEGDLAINEEWVYD